ncbi:hypothetical protein EVG20_g1449 [Dentipellis fragilis]|uniref:Uncharacterized protein n=1 Tax=Dentipellis fragilis TaxID=205917 RepID=A0A4Y9ZCN1_9AGAM|nr:hypothetical protein EVG20_g1449 [Dentipellis fragilis]
MLAYTYIFLLVWSAPISALPVVPRGFINGSLAIPVGNVGAPSILQAFDVNTTVSSNASSTAEPAYPSALIRPLFPEPGPVVSGPGPEILPSGIPLSTLNIPRCVDASILRTISLLTLFHRDFNASVLGGVEDELNGGNSVTDSSSADGTSSADPAHPSARIDSLLHFPPKVDSLSSDPAFRRSKALSFNASAILEGIKSALGGDNSEVTTSSDADSTSSADPAHPRSVSSLRTVCRRLTFGYDNGRVDSVPFSIGPVAGREKTSHPMEIDPAGSSLPYDGSFLHAQLYDISRGRSRLTS